MNAADGGRAWDRTIWYVSLELPREGDASYTHITAILRGLTARGWRSRLWIPAHRPGRRGAARRLRDAIVTQMRLFSQKARPDVLYVRGHYAALPSVIWAKLRRVPVVVEVNGPPTDILSSWPRLRVLMPFLTWAGTWQIRLASAVIAVTPELAHIAADQGAGRVFVVSNGADAELFAPAERRRRARDLGVPKKFVSFTGTLATWHRIDTLLDAVTAPAWPSDVSLVVIGDGVMADFVRRGAEANPRIIYMGRLSQSDVARVVARSLAAVSPMSTGGRSPLKLFEAMACGVPAIVADMPGQADIVLETGCGLVVPGGDPEAIADAVAKLAADSSLAREMGRRGRIAAETKYSWDAAAGTTHDILVDLTSGP